MTDTEPNGLEARYSVKRLRDVTGKHDACPYFVLDPQHDPHATPALRAYARAVRDENPALATDLTAWVGVEQEPDDRETPSVSMVDVVAPSCGDPSAEPAPEPDAYRCPACRRACRWVDDAWVCAGRGGCGSEYTPEPDDREAAPTNNGHRWPCTRFYQTSSERDRCSCAPEPVKAEEEPDDREALAIRELSGTIGGLGRRDNEWMRTWNALVHFADAYRARLGHAPNEAARVDFLTAIGFRRHPEPVKPTCESVWQAWHGTEEPWGGCADAESVGRVLALWPGRIVAEVKAEERARLVAMLDADAEQLDERGDACATGVMRAVRLIGRAHGIEQGS